MQFSERPPHRPHGPRPPAGEPPREPTHPYFGRWGHATERQALLKLPALLEAHTAALQSHTAETRALATEIRALCRELERHRTAGSGRGDAR